MAYIEPEINDFLTAVYGEEVRNSMVSLARKLNVELEAGTATINQYTTDITQAIAEADTAAGNANAARDQAVTARDAANSAASAANTARDNANEAASAANSAAAEARSQAQQAEQKRVAIEANENMRQSNERDRESAEAERRRAFADMAQQVLPAATTTTLGGVIVGDGLTVDSNGKIGVTGGGDYETRTHAEATYAKITDLDGKADTSHVHAAADITSGTLPIARGGTGITSNPSMLTDLGSTAAATVMQASPRPGVTGTLPVANGGTGVTSSPSMLADLGSTTAADVLQASPRPGITGTLPVDHGGTGATTHTANAVLTGNGASAVNNVATASGALYATAANGAAQFGTLPIAQGGTGATTAADAVENIVDGQDIEPQSINATGDIYTSDGGIHTDSGEVFVLDGDVWTGHGDVYTRYGDIFTRYGDVIVKDATGLDLHKLSEKANSAAVAKVESRTATTATPEGGLFMLDGNLYRATTDIAVGATINSSNSVQTNMNAKIDGVWNNCLHLRGTTMDTGASQDYDDYTALGYWYVDTSMTGHAPETGLNLGILITFPSDDLTWQVMYSAMTAKIHHRHRNSAGVWSAWHTLG